MPKNSPVIDRKVLKVFRLIQDGMPTMKACAKVKLSRSTYNSRMSKLMAYEYDNYSPPPVREFL